MDNTSGVRASRAHGIMVWLHDVRRAYRASEGMGASQGARRFVTGTGEKDAATWSVLEHRPRPVPAEAACQFG